MHHAAYIRSVLDAYLVAHQGSPLLFSLAQDDSIEPDAAIMEEDPMNIARVLCCWARINAHSILPQKLEERFKRIEACEVGSNVIQELAGCFADQNPDELEGVSNLLIFLNKHILLTPSASSKQELTQVAKAFSPLFFRSSEASGILLTAVLVTHIHRILPTTNILLSPTSICNLALSPASPSISPLSLSSSKSQEPDSPFSSPLQLPNPFASKQQQANTLSLDCHAQLWNTSESVELRSLVALSVSSCLFDTPDDD